MQMYIKDDYYKNIYKGQIEDSKLNNLIVEASRYIQKHTFDRAESDIEAVRWCCCVLVDKIQEYKEQKEKYKKQNNKKSETVGKWSISYADTKTNLEIEKELEDEVNSTIKFYLSDVTDKNGVNLLYRGS